eukprot:scaffold2352_cov153-Ochromonas_danica.AAC.15
MKREGWAHKPTLRCQRQKARRSPNPHVSLLTSHKVFLTDGKRVLFLEAQNVCMGCSRRSAFVWVARAEVMRFIRIEFFREPFPKFA